MQNTDFHYNEPIQSMYLSTLSNQKITRPLTAQRDGMKVDDIDGARPKFIQKPIKPRQTFYNRNDDIARSKPKVLIPQQPNKPQFNMKVDDIDGTRSKMNKFTSSRNTNPLNPVYQLPNVQYYPVQQPKFIRDNMVTYDIEGTSTKESFPMRLEKEGKVLNSKEDVLKAIQLKKKNTLRKSENTTFLNVDDICIKKKQFNCTRTTNPLDPQYMVPKQNEKGAQKYGIIEKSKPPGPKPKSSNSDFSLQTSDIVGAKPKQNNFVIPAKEQIVQAKVNSLKRGLSSNRKTNPLNPTYKYPGWSDMKPFTAYERPKTAHQKFDAFIGN